MIPQVVVAFLNLWLWAVGRSGWLKHHGEPPGDIGLVAVYEQTLYYVYENNLGFSALQIPEKSNIHRSGGNFVSRKHGSVSKMTFPVNYDAINELTCHRWWFEAPNII